MATGLTKTALTRQMAEKLELTNKQAGAFLDLLAETAVRTNLSKLRVGSLVNLERPMLAASRFDGHIVQGHVDATAIIMTIEGLGQDHRIEIALPDAFQRYIVFKGSIAVNGISLTVAEVRERSFVVWIIPHTWDRTNLHSLAPGSRVNLEFDVVAKYVERMLQTSGVLSEAVEPERVEAARNKERSLEFGDFLAPKA